MISVSNLTKSYTGETGVSRAVAGIDFEIPAGQFLTLLGPSGCGKTTTLRCLAGLERPERGQIWIGDRVVVDTDRRVFLPVNKRRIGMVFQSYAIWPHMTVLDNVCYPLVELKLPRREIRERGEAALAVVGLEGLGNRLAPHLSGGQQQRVALARALVAEPSVLLLDEPLSNLDAKLRETMRGELRALQQRLGITTVYVTHDQTEALSMSDNIAVMHQGKIVEQGTPRDLYERPKTRFVAEFLGMTNFVARCPHPQHGDTWSNSKGSALRSVRPEDIEVIPAPKRRDGAAGVWEGRVVKALFLGSHTSCQVAVGDQVIEANAHHAYQITAGDTVSVSWGERFCTPILPEGVPAEDQHVEQGGQAVTAGV